MEHEQTTFPEIPLFFGRYLVHQGVITDQALHDALTLQSDICGNPALIALETGVISQQQFIECRSYQRQHSVTFEAATRALNYIAESTFQDMLDRLHRERLPLGQILVRLGKLTEDELVDLLADYRVNGTL